MPNLLFLCHRIPYPPNKGDKIRSFHFLRALAKQYSISLATFVDDPNDAQYLSALAPYCARICAVPLHPTFRRLRSLRGLLSGKALSVEFYDHPEIWNWLRREVVQNPPDAVFVYSSPMAQYVNQLDDIDRLIDFVDVDSDKWQQYAQASGTATAWLYRREADRLLEFERYSAARAIASVFVTQAESALFRRLAGDLISPVITVENGVDAGYFSSASMARPEGWQQGRDEAGNRNIVFTGAMDYKPNVDAAAWFSREVMPLIRHQLPAATFWIVGARPTAEVRSLARTDEVFVTGTVADVRPYLAHAGVVVVPDRKSVV